MQHNHSHGNNINDKTSLEFKHLNDFIKYKIYWELSKEFKEARRNKEVACGEVINNYDIGVHSIHWIFWCNAHHSIKNMDWNLLKTIQNSPHVSCWVMKLSCSQMSHKCRLCSSKYSHQFPIGRKIHWLTHMQD